MMRSCKSRLRRNRLQTELAVVAESLMVPRPYGCSRNIRTNEEMIKLKIRRSLACSRKTQKNRKFPEEKTWHQQRGERKRKVLRTKQMRVRPSSV